MDSDKLISATIKFVLAFGLTAFLLVKGWLGSYEKIVINDEPITFYKVFTVEENPLENIFFKKSLYKSEDIERFVKRINGEAFFLNEKMALCNEEVAIYVAVKVKEINVK